MQSLISTSPFQAVKCNRTRYIYWNTHWGPGGPLEQGYDVWVTLERQGHRASVPFGALVYEPSNNIFVIPNDVIYLYRQPQTFLAFGAAGTQGQFKFDAWRLSLAEAVGR